MDQGYTVANFEDVDFNLKVRDAGLEVIYQPECCMTHYWGTTVKSKQDDADSPALFMEQNFSRLMSKWYLKLAQGLASA